MSKSQKTEPDPAKDRPAVDETVAANELRLSPRQWLVAAPLMLALLVAVPMIWDNVERFEPAPDYRIPRAQGNDYWTFRRWARLATERDDVIVLGDSVIWGDTVAPDETLSSRLNALAEGEGLPDRFANLGLLGGYPAVLEGLLGEYGRSIAGRRVLLHCNLRWLVSPRADLQEANDATRLNHPRLLPQWPGDVPAYEATLSDRTSIVMSRKTPFANWSDHLQQAYFHGNAARWTIEHPNQNPLGQITLRLPAPRPRETPATTQAARITYRVDYRWVQAASSVQWRQFRRAVQLLRQRGCRLVVCVGPLNEHMLTDASLRRYRKCEAAVLAWLQSEAVVVCHPSPLPEEQYDDLSHPNPAGYEALARRLWKEDAFRTALGLPISDATSDRGL